MSNPSKDVPLINPMTVQDLSRASVVVSSRSIRAEKIKMNFELLQKNKLAVRDAARDFAQNVLKPGVIDRDNEQRFPADEIRQLGELGFLGIMVDPKYGGSGMDAISYVLAMEEISKVDASTSC